jgi:hypothetical protein
METPFGPFESTVELTEEETFRIMKALGFVEFVMNTSDGFSIDVSEDQPLVVKTINGKRLEIPVFEAAELDARRMYGYPPNHQVPLRIDGQPQNVVTSTEFELKIDAQTATLIMAQNIDSGAPEWFRNLFN